MMTMLEELVAKIDAIIWGLMALGIWSVTSVFLIIYSLERLEKKDDPD